MLTATEAKESLTYNQITGEFSRNRGGHGVSAGQIIGKTNKNDYVRMRVNGGIYQAHRLAWLITYGEFPCVELDHINRIKSDNRICNLRLATKSENMKNKGMRKDNTSGFKGVCWNKKYKKWAATIKKDGKQFNIGLFNSREGAHEAYQKASFILYPNINGGI